MKNSKLIPLICTILLFIFSSCSHKIFVSKDGSDENPGTRSRPLKTPEAAVEKVSGINKENRGKNINIIFAAGKYYLKEGLHFAHRDGGTEKYEVTYEAKKGDEVVFSGGKEINNWILREDGLWEAIVNGEEVFEQLYINGVRATRARIPNTEDQLSRWYIDSIQVRVNQETGLFDQFMIRLRDSESLENLNWTGTSEIIIFKDWATLRKQVGLYEPETGFLNLKPPFAFFQGNYNGLMAPYSSRFTAYLEGDKTFIDQPGEWAVDRERSVLLYYPEPGEDILTSKAVIPEIKTLVSIKGNENGRVNNLHFKNIRFENASYMLPEYGHDGRQACFYYTDGTGLKNQEALIDEAIRIEWAENCSFSNCEISRTGANGIYITNGSRDIRLEKSKLFDIGGNGIMIGTAYDPKEDSSCLVKGILVSDCELFNAGQHYQSAVGIWLGFAADCMIIGNHIYEMPYTGISIGWQWNPLPTSSKNNLIAENHIHDVMKMLGDGGGIYTLGYQPGSLIRDNEIHDIHRSELNHASPNNGMFIDEGSKGYLVENNHIYNVVHTCIRGHRAAGVELKGNTFEPGELPAISHTPPYGAMIFANKDSTIEWSNPGWPAEWGYPERITAFTMTGNIFEMTNDND